MQPHSSYGWKLGDLAALVSRDGPAALGDARLFVVGGETQIASLFSRTIEGPGPTDSVTMMVKPLVRRTSSDLPFVTIGRLDGNDVALGCRSVSAYHAFALVDGDRWTLYDAGSRNGTFINKARVPVRGEGLAANMRSGDSITFGTWVGVVLDVASLCEYLSALNPSTH